MCISTATRSESDVYTVSPQICRDLTCSVMKVRNMLRNCFVRLNASRIMFGLM